MQILVITRSLIYRNYCGVFFQIQVRSPTREALAEHDLREQHSHAGTNTMHAVRKEDILYFFCGKLGDS